MHDVATHAATHDDSKGQYFWVWGALLVLTAVEVVLGYKQIFEPVRMLEALLVLSIIKSALIIGYFMHLKFEKALMRWMLVLSVRPVSSSCISFSFRMRGEFCAWECSSA